MHKGVTVFADDGTNESNVPHLQKMGGTTSQQTTNGTEDTSFIHSSNTEQVTLPLYDLIFLFEPSKFKNYFGSRSMLTLKALRLS